MTVIKNTQQLTLADIWRPLAQLLYRLNGKNGAEWLHAFKRFLRKEHPWLSTKWKVWTVAKVGTGKPLAELIKIIKDRGYSICYSEHSPMDLLLIESLLEFNKKEEDVYFTLVSPKDLGLKPGWTKRKFLDRSIKNGLTPCLPGDIIEILAQGKEIYDQEKNHFDVAMEPVLIGNCHANFCFANFRDGDFHFGYHNGDLEQIWDFPGNVNNKHVFRIVNNF